MDRERLSRKRQASRSGHHSADCANIMHTDQVLNTVYISDTLLYAVKRKCAILYKPVSAVSVRSVFVSHFLKFPPRTMYYFNKKCDLN